MLAPKWLGGLIERVCSREPKVMQEVWIVRNVAESGALSASLVPDPPFFQ